MFRIDFNKLRFLVCDDNPHMRRILRTLLHSFGAREVYEAEDGATALEMYTHYVPDIVITDWSMPIFDGLELAQMIRQPESKGNPYAPIIMLTGHSEKRRVTVARDAGVTEFLAKPISAKGLYQRILNVVANPAPLHQDQDLFRPGPPPQHHQRLYRPRAPHRRRGRSDAAALAARQGAVQRLARAARKPHMAKEKPGDARGQDLRRPSRHHAAQSAAQGAAARRRERSRRSGRARRKGAGGPVGRIQELDGDRGRPALGRARRHPAGTASPTTPATSCFAPPMTSRATPRPSAFPPPAPPPKACAGSSSTRPTSTRCRPN